MHEEPPENTTGQLGPPLTLASGSPRRHLLLTEAGYLHDVVAPEVDETQLEGEAAETYVARVSSAKSLSAVGGDGFAIGADTIVVNAGLVLGKPRTRGEASLMLRSLSGGCHRVLTGWCISRRGEMVASGIGTTQVTFRDLSDSEIERYIATGEPMDRAGAYAIQGGARHFVASTVGSFTNVMGLPMEAMTKALAELGILPAEIQPIAPSDRRSEMPSVGRER